MFDDQPASAITAAAVETLMGLDQHGRGACPDDTDPERWAAAVLDDLARVAKLLDGAVTQVSGRRNDTVTQNTQALAAAIAAHRNLHVRGPHD